MFYHVYFKQAKHMSADDIKELVDMTCSDKAFDCLFKMFETGKSCTFLKTYFAYRFAYNIYQYINCFPYLPFLKKFPILKPSTKI